MFSILITDCHTFSVVEINLDQNVLLPTIVKGLKYQSDEYLKLKLFCLRYQHATLRKCHQVFPCVVFSFQAKTAATLSQTLQRPFRKGSKDDDSIGEELHIGAPFDVTHTDLRAVYNEETEKWVLTNSGVKQIESPSESSAMPPKPAPRTKLEQKKTPPPRPPPPCISKHRKYSIDSNIEEDKTPQIPHRSKNTASLSDLQLDSVMRPVPKPRPSSAYNVADTQRPIPKARGLRDASKQQRTSASTSSKESTTSSIISTGSVEKNYKNRSSLESDRESKRSWMSSQSFPSPTISEIEIQARNSQNTLQRRCMPLPAPPQSQLTIPHVLDESGRTESSVFEGGVTDSLYQRLTAYGNTNPSLRPLETLSPDINICPKTLGELARMREPNRLKHFSENVYFADRYSPEPVQTNEGNEAMYKDTTVPEVTISSDNTNITTPYEEDEIYAIPMSEALVEADTTWGITQNISVPPSEARFCDEGTAFHGSYPLTTDQSSVDTASISLLSQGLQASANHLPISREHLLPVPNAERESAYAKLPEKSENDDTKYERLSHTSTSSRQSHLVAHL